MGWQDAPLVADGNSGWQAAPEQVPDPIPRPADAPVWASAPVVDEIPTQAPAWASAPEATPEALGVFGELGRGWEQGVAQTQESFGLGIPTIMYQAGLSDPRTFARHAAAYRKRIPGAEAPQPERWSPEWIAQSLGGMLPAAATTIGTTIATTVGGSAIGSLAGGPVGGAIGGTTGLYAGLTSSGALLTNATAFLDYLQQRLPTLDMSDENAIATALEQNPDLGDEASHYALIRAGIAGGVNALAGAVGGKVAGRFFGPEATYASRVAGTGADVAVGAVTTAGGEAASQIATEGRISDFDRIVDTGAIGLIGGAVPAVLGGAKLGVRLAKRGVNILSPAATKPTSSVILDEATGHLVLSPEYAARVAADPTTALGLELVRVIDEVQRNARSNQAASLAATSWADQIRQRLTPVQRSHPLFEAALKSIDRIATYKPSASLEDVMEAVSQGVGVKQILTQRPTLGSDYIFTSLVAGEVKIETSMGFLGPSGQTGIWRPHVGGRTTLIVESASRPLTAPEIFTLLREAKSNGADSVSFRPGSKASDSIRSDLLFDVDVMPDFSNKAEALPTYKIDLGVIQPRMSETLSSKSEAATPAVGSTEPDFNMQSPEDQVAQVTRVQKAMRYLIQKMKLSVPVKFQTYAHDEGSYANQTTWGYAGPHLTGTNPHYELAIYPTRHKALSQMWETAVHELGHIFMWDKVSRASPEVQWALLKEYTAWRNSLDSAVIKGDPLDAYVRDRTSVMDYQSGQYHPGVVKNESDSFHRYWRSYSEWFAQQAAKWGSSDLRPLSIVDKFFSGMARQLLSNITDLFALQGWKFEASKLVSDIFNAALLDMDPGAFANIYQKLALQSLLANQSALNAIGLDEVEAIVQTEATDGARAVLSNLYAGGKGGKPGDPGWKSGEKFPLAGLVAIQDRMNRFYNLTLGLPQLAALNAKLRPLVLYNDLIQRAGLEVSQWSAKATATLAAAKRLGQKQIDQLQTILDDYVNMRYRSQDEADRGVERMPSQAELDIMLRDLTPEGREMFHRMVKDFDDFLEAWADVMRTEAGKITDLAAQARRLTDIDQQFAAMRKTPYVPMMRWGRYTTTIRDTDGNVVAFSMFESKAERRAARARLQTLYPDPLFQHFDAIMAEDTGPLVGMPPGLLRMIAEKLDLSKTQKQAIEDLQYQLAPAVSHRHRLQVRERTPGYSQDFLRAYASYFMHGSNYIVRSKYRDDLAGYVKHVGETAKIMPDGDKRMQIRNYMQDHLQEWLDPKPDFHRLKAAAFFVYLGYNVTSALVNLSQLPIMTLPYLARGFGDLTAAAALTRAGTDLTTYYKKANLEAGGRNDRTLRMLNALWEGGTVTEALSSQLAGTAEGRNLTQKLLGSAAQRSFSWIMEKSAFFFQMTEQMNRRVTAVAAFELALAHPTSKLVREAMELHAPQFQSLIERGWSPHEAQAVVTAKHSVEQTQGQYSRAARPRIFRGAKGALFMFKAFQQMTLFTMWNHPTVAVRSVLITAFLGGLMGVPGLEDVSDLLKSLAYKLFGSDFDLEREVRKFILDVGAGNISPDLLLHGTSRYGFGLPAVANLWGVPAPNFDISGRLGLGQISPVPLSPFFGPAVDPDRALGQSVEKAAGVAFGLMFTLAKVATDLENKRAWLRLVPRFLGNLNRAYDEYNNQVTTANGAKIVDFDANDPEQMMEMLGTAIGFQPTRLTTEWDRLAAIREVTTYWNLRRAGLLEQFAAAKDTGDPTVVKDVIAAVKNFNRMLPPGAGMKAITADTLRASMATRMKVRQQQEAGLGVNKSDIGLVKGVSALFPETVAGAKVIARSVQVAKP